MIFFSSSFSSEATCFLLIIIFFSLRTEIRKYIQKRKQRNTLNITLESTGISKTNDTIAMYKYTFMYPYFILLFFFRQLFPFCVACVAWQTHRDHVRPRRRRCGCRCHTFRFHSITFEGMY